MNLPMTYQDTYWTVLAIITVLLMQIMYLLEREQKRVAKDAQENAALRNQIEELEQKLVDSETTYKTRYYDYLKDLTEITESHRVLTDKFKSISEELKRNNEAKFTQIVLNKQATGSYKGLTVDEVYRMYSPQITNYTAIHAVQSRAAAYRAEKIE